LPSVPLPDAAGPSMAIIMKAMCDTAAMMVKAIN
jgi:hypothetical protein